MDGRVRVALRVLDDSAVRDGIWYCGPAYLADRGMPVPETIMEQRYAASLADSALFSTPHPVMCAAQLAARLGDWTRHEALLARARAVAAREQGAGNRLGAIQWNRAVLSAEAHGLWRQGRTEAALDAFERSLTGGAWRSLWHVGELSLEVGQLDRAERAFRALLGRDGTPAYLQLARILEQTGRPAEAREAYEFVADAWRGADPELRPIAEKAHTEGMRLSRAGH